MTNQDEVQAIHTTVEELKVKVTNRDRLKRLEKNYDFKALILQGYFKDKPVELSRVAAQVTLNEQSKQVWENAQVGISSLQGHLHSIYTEGNAAEAALAEYNAEAGSELV
jgi:hypothetical protein